MLENFDPSSYIAIFRKDLVPNIRESLEGVVARLEQKIHQSKSPTESINLFSATMRLITELGNDKIINYYLIKAEQIQGAIEQTGTKTQGKYEVLYKGDYNHIGEVLLDFRRQAGLSQSAVADHLDINQSHLSRLERGFRKSLSAKYLKKFLGLFDINPKQRVEDILELIERPHREKQEGRYLDDHS